MHFFIHSDRAPEITVTLPFITDTSAASGRVGTNDRAFSISKKASFGILVASSAVSRSCIVVLLAASKIVAIIICLDPIPPKWCWWNTRCVHTDISMLTVELVFADWNSGYTRGIAAAADFTGTVSSANCIKTGIDDACSTTIVLHDARCIGAVAKALKTWVRDDGCVSCVILGNTVIR